MDKKIIEALGEKAKEFEDLLKKSDLKVVVGNDGSYIPKNVLDDEKKKLTTEIDNYKSEITNVTTKLKEFESLTGENEQLKTQINDLKSNTEKIESDWKSKLEILNKETKIENAIRESGAKNIKAVKALLDLEVVKLDGDNLLGLNDQLDKAKSDNDYLFGEIKAQGKAPEKPAQNEPGDNFISRSDYMALSEDEKESSAIRTKMKNSVSKWE